MPESSSGLARLSSSFNQKQQSGETLSSFESDYDLLVYLGETETEDIVDTERSLDYQDQTWRQSICGGASLAPTIDESLSELLLNEHNRSDFDLLNTPTPTVAGSPFSTRSGSPALRSPPSYYLPSTSGTTASCSQRAPTSKSPAGRANQQVRQESLNPARSALVEPKQEEQHNEDDVSFVLNNLANNNSNLRRQQAQPTTSTPPNRLLGAQSGSSKIPALVKRNEPPQEQRGDNQRFTGYKWPQTHGQENIRGGQEQQLEQKFGANFGNKLVSLFNKKPVGQIDEFNRAKSRTLGTRPIQLEEDSYPSSDASYSQRNYRRHSPPILDRYNNLINQNEMIGSNRKRNNEQHLQGGAMSANDADELDRLLAEMSQTLDLDSLARFDTQPYQPAAYSSVKHQQHQQAATSQTLNKFQSPSSNAPAIAKQEQSFQHRSSPSLAVEKPQQGRSRLEPTTTTASIGFRQPQTANRPTGGTMPRQVNQQPATTSCESILDEYDGASRMLEQMLSDHLLDQEGSPVLRGKRTKPTRGGGSGQSEANSKSVLSGSAPANRQTLARLAADNDSKNLIATSATMPTKTIPSGRNSRGSVIESSETQLPESCQTLAGDRSGFTTTATASTTSGRSSPTRKLSTCSSSAATEQSVVLASSFVGRDQAQASKLENRSLWRHSKRPAHEGQQQAVVGKPQTTSSKPADQDNDISQGDDKEEVALKRLDDNRGETTAKISPGQQEAETSLPPPPPAVDYDDANNVISVQAAEFPSQLSDEEESRQRVEPRRDGSSRMDMMKRRTLSSMRSMRNKLSDFMGASSADSATSSGKQHKPPPPVASTSLGADTSASTSAPAAPRSQETGVKSKKQKAPPIPPKRSSSIGSDSSRRASLARSAPEPSAPQVASGQVALQAPPPVRPRQKRESRSATRRAAPVPIEPAEKSKPTQAGQQSFGQQIRERLSRSKSRISKFLRPSQAKRAQSTPNTKQLAQQQVDDDDLVQPGDIARNCEPVKRDSSFEESLDRHLARSLAPESPTQQRRSSSSDSSSRISGLDTSARSSRQKKRRSKPANGSKSEGGRRSTSLLSIKRLSLRSQKEPVQEDLDTMKVGTSGGDSQKASPSKRRRKDRRAKRKSAGGESSGSIVVAKVATTNEYFGQVAPAKVTDSDSKDTSSSESAEDTKKPQSGTLPVILNETPGVRWPNRSHSLKSVGTPNKSSLRTGGDALRNQRTVSFSNLNRQRLPLPTNSFRPVSACAQLEQTAAPGEPGEVRPAEAGQVTPVAPSCPELVCESAKPAQLSKVPYLGSQSKLKPPPSPGGSDVSPTRAKSATMLEDFRSKCNQLFSTSPTATRKPRQTPVRPPRRYNFRRRSKSTTGRPDEESETSGGAKVIVVDAASPTSTLGSGREEPDKQQPLGKKITTFAQHLKESASDFFHPGKETQAGRRGRTKERQGAACDRAPNEVALCEWQPVIQRSKRPASARRSLVSIGGLKGKLTKF